MKRTLAILITAAASALTATAQEEIFDNPDNASRFGVRVNYELACPTNISYIPLGGAKVSESIFGNGSGFSVEGIYNMPVWKNLYFEPGVGIYYNTFSIDNDLIKSGMFEELTGGSARQWGLRIPLNIGYRFDLLDWLSLSFFTGPEINISFSGRTHFSYDKYSISGPLFGKDGYLNRADIKWRFGVGAIFNQRYTLGISGAVGMCDSARYFPTLLDKSHDIDYIVLAADVKMHSNLFTISLGYLF